MKVGDPPSIYLIIIGVVEYDLSGGFSLYIRPKGKSLSVYDFFSRF